MQPRDKILSSLLQSKVIPFSIQKKYSTIVLLFFIFHNKNHRNCIQSFSIRTASQSMKLILPRKKKKPILLASLKCYISF